MDESLTFPLLGGCSEHPACPAAPFGNVISHTTAVNMAPSTCTIAFSCNKQVIDGQISLPAEKEFKKASSRAIRWTAMCGHI